MTATRARRPAALVLLALCWVVVRPAPASADAAGPTNYESSVTAVEPPVAGIEVEIIGGDSFLLLTVEGSTTVEVVGYRGEPYLRFMPGGIVEQNDRSPTTYLNEDRYAVANVPAEATPDAIPRWREVATDGSFAWHDHRAHWMNEVPPPGKGPGDQILEGVVPLLVDGREVDLTVISVWQSEPSRVPPLAGVLVGLGLAALAARRGRMRRSAVALLGLAAAAFGVGLAAFLSVPPETVPEWSLWIVPAFSALLALAVAASAGTSSPVGRNAASIVFVAAVALLMWGVVRWDWLWLSVLPTNLPYWLDRFITAAALAGAVGVGVSVMAAAVRPGRARSAGT